MILTTKQAEAIAKSQRDLGGKTQKILAKVLSNEGVKLNKGNDELDLLSYLIAITIGEAEDLDNAEDTIDYYLNQLIELKRTIIKLY